MGLGILSKWGLGVWDRMGNSRMLPPLSAVHTPEKAFFGPNAVTVDFFC